MKSPKISGELLLCESSHPFVVSASVCMNAGNWIASDAIANTEARLEFKKIMGYHLSHKTGLGSFSIPETPAKNSHAYGKLLSTVQEEANKEKLLAHAGQLKLEGQWTKWCSFVRMDFSWKSVLSMPPSLLAFHIGATCNTLPSLFNLHRWNISAETSCQLCHKQNCTHSWRL